MPYICFNLALFGFWPSFKGQGFHLWLSANRIALFHWTLDLGPSSKVALIEQSSEHMICSYAPLWPALGFALLALTWVLCLCSFFPTPPPPPLCWVLCLFKFPRVSSEHLLFPEEVDHQHTHTHFRKAMQELQILFCSWPCHLTMSGRVLSPVPVGTSLGLDRFSLVVVCSTYQGLFRSVLCVGDRFIRWWMVHWGRVCWSV